MTYIAHLQKVVLFHGGPLGLMLYRQFRLSSLFLSLALSLLPTSLSVSSSVILCTTISLKYRDVSKDLRVLRKLYGNIQTYLQQKHIKVGVQDESNWDHLWKIVNT